MTTIPPPLISVVLTVYNEERFLERCLDSPVVQSLDNIEIIGVDNGSTDSSPEIFRAHAKKDQQIHILTSPTKKKIAVSARLVTGGCKRRSDTIPPLIRMIFSKWTQ